MGDREFRDGGDEVDNGELHSNQFHRSISESVGAEGPEERGWFMKSPIPVGSRAHRRGFQALSTRRTSIFHGARKSLSFRRYRAASSRQPPDPLRGPFGEPPSNCKAYASTQGDVAAYCVGKMMGENASGFRVPTGAACGRYTSRTSSADCPG